MKLFRVKNAFVFFSFLSVMFLSCEKREEYISNIEIAGGISQNVFVGDSGKLSIKYYPEYLATPKLSWRSNNTSVIEINEKTGEYIAKSVGAGVVIATATELNLTSMCRINVKPVELLDISVSPTYKKIFLGEEFSLQVNFNPDNSTYKYINWSSSDYSIATVDSKGKVLAIKDGECVIKAESINGKFAECRLEVKPIQVDGIEISCTEKELEKKEEFYLSINFIPSNATYKDLVWSSSDPNIAKVDSEGKVSAVSEGECIIKAESINGKVAECKVKVKPFSVKKVSFVESEKNILVGESSKVNFNIEPTDAKVYSLKWKTADESVATVSQDGIITCNKKERTKLTLIVNDKYEAECNIIGCDIEDLVSLQFGSSAIISINGYTRGDIGVNIFNKSSRNIIAKSLQVIHGDTGFEGNVMDLNNKSVDAESHVGYIITIKLPIYNPIFRFVYIYQGKEYTIDLQYN